MGKVGYLLVTPNRHPLPTQLKPGLVIDTKSQEPPWLVLDHDLHTMNVSDWPFDIWEAEVLRAISPQGHRGNYTRCRAIKIRTQLPAHIVFGPEDVGIGELLDFAGSLDLNQAEALASHIQPSASQLYSKAWSAWLHTLEDNVNRHLSDHKLPSNYPVHATALHSGRRLQ